VRQERDQLAGAAEAVRELRVSRHRGQVAMPVDQVRRAPLEVERDEDVEGLRAALVEPEPGTRPLEGARQPLVVDLVGDELDLLGRSRIVRSFPVSAE
jgi:hypothetical protein